jgi:hypothetical protein
VKASQSGCGKMDTNQFLGIFDFWTLEKFERLSHFSVFNLCERRLAPYKCEQYDAALQNGSGIVLIRVTYSSVYFRICETGYLGKNIMRLWPLLLQSPWFED